MLKIKIEKYYDFKKAKEKLIGFEGEIKEFNNSCYFIMTVSGKSIGYAVFSKNEGKRYIDYICIKKKYRYQSYGTKLIGKIFEEAATENIDEIYAKANECSTYFFRRAGFTENKGEMKISNLLAEKKRKKEGIKGSLVSIIVNIFLSVAKIAFGIIGKSRALVADGFHSLSDVVTSIVVLVSIFIASKPADEDHPYGHGQLESISGNFIGIILILTSFELLTENIKSLFSGAELAVPKFVTLYIIVAAIIIKYILYVYKYNMGIRLKNDAIIADAKDHKSDVISSVGVLIGILLAKFVNPYFDIIAGLAVALIIGKEGIEIVLHNSNKIMDIQEEDFLFDIRELCEKDEEVYNVHDMIMKSSGDKIYLAFHARVDKNLTIEESHIIVDRLMDSIKEKYPYIKDIIIHIDPIRE